MTDAIRAALEGAGAHLTEHPNEARHTDSVATARFEAGLRVAVEGSNNERLVTESLCPPTPGVPLHIEVTTA